MTATAEPPVADEPRPPGERVNGASHSAGLHRLTGPHRIRLSPLPEPRPEPPDAEPDAEPDATARELREMRREMARLRSEYAQLRDLLSTAQGVDRGAADTVSPAPTEAIVVVERNRAAAGPTRRAPGPDAGAPSEASSPHPGGSAASAPA
ncbi:MAG: hypothetical protein JOY78_02500, partial [Pseudonocardia sp.]|nr:hypothetical protein [Pseudonocardia sp.]